MLPQGSLGTATACSLEMQSTGSADAAGPATAEGVVGPLLVQDSQGTAEVTTSNLAILSSGIAALAVGGSGTSA